MLRFTDHTGAERVLGNIQPAQHPLMRWRTFGESETTRLVPRSAWPALIRAYLEGHVHYCLPPVHDQGPIGQCNADAVAAAAEFCRIFQGLPFVALSAADLYHRINYGTDRGSLLEDAMLEMTAVGIGTAQTAGLRWHRAMTEASFAERARFRVLEYYLCPSFDHLMSAVLMGFAVISGVRWWEDYSPDVEGWMPAVGRGRQGGHAIMGYKPASRDGEFGIWHQNSYGAGWGKEGCCVLPESAYREPIGGWWAVRQMTTEDLGELPLLVA